MKQRALFIYNPIAGKSKKLDLPSMIETHLDKDQFDFEVKPTEYAGHATQLASTAADQSIQLVVAVGGDGTMNEVATGLMGSRSVLGIIPSGSGNGLARHLGISLKIPEAIRCLSECEQISMDVGNVNGRYFFNAAGIGFDGLIAAEFAKHNKRGFWTYMRLIFQNMGSYKRRTYTVGMNGKQQTLPMTLIAIANAKQYGNNFVIAPNAEIDSGKLEVCLMPSFFSMISVLQMLRWLAGKYYINKQVPGISTTEIRIKGQDLQMHLDGEPVKVGDHVHVQVMPAALKVLKPK